jgi:hypothetical protein
LLIAALAGGLVALAGVIGGAGLAAAAPAGTAPQRVHPMSSCAGSGQSGGQVAQATVLARAQVWVDQNVPYTQNCANLPGGYYREDCSGFISMAWELSSSLITTEFNPKYDGGDARFAAIGRAALVPGDALVRDDTGNPGDSSEHHIVLFVGWSSNDGGAHRYANIQEESTFGVGTVAKNGQDLTDSYWGAFTPIHYVNMVVPAPPPQSRLGVLTTGGVAYVKEGGLSAAWVHEDNDVQQVVVSGDRIGVLTTDGVAYVKEGGLSAAWVHEYTGVQQLALSGDRIGVLTTAGAALVKDGDLGAAWDTEYSGVQQLALSGNRIGIITTAGVAYVKDGDLGASWVHEDDGVQQLALAGDRIGVLTTGGVAYVKDGDLGAAWVHENDNIQQLALAGNRIGILTIAGIAYVKDGDLGASWVHEDDGVRQIALAGDRIAILTTAQVAYAKDGGLSTAWVHEDDDIQQISVS